MKKLKGLYDSLVSRFLGIISDKKGQTLVEYALLLVLIALVGFLMVKGTGSQVNTV